MHSAILGIPNGANQETGEMLVGYPSTMIGSDVSTEVGRLRLRMYLGAAIYRPENVMILPDVAWGALKNIEEIDLGDVNPGSATGFRLIKESPTTFTLTVPGTNSNIIGPSDGTLNASAQGAGVYSKLQGLTIYQAATFDGDNKPKKMNTGHLGCLDSPECGDRVFGNHVYSATPNPTAAH